MKIEMTYCGRPSGTTWARGCNSTNGACPQCLRAHIARLEAALKEAEGARVVPEVTPASRVLKDGELAATEIAIKNARKWLNFAAIWTSPTREEEVLRSAFARSLEELDALRAQPTEERKG